MKKAVVLLSGGIDSSTTLAHARREGFELYALSFRYGQKNRFELEAARRIAMNLDATQHRIIDVDLSDVCISALTADIPVPKDRKLNAESPEIPTTYVPARNIIFLSLGLAWAETLGALDIFIGVNATDYSGYPDCRPEFIEAYEHMANLGTKAGVSGQQFRIHTPLIGMTKAEIIRHGNDLGLDYDQTQSCYEPDSEGRACGHCDSCTIRKKGFIEANVPDPTVYAE